MTNYRTAADHVIELIGNIKLADLKARDVQAALTKLAVQKSTRSVRMYRMVLVRAIRHAQINDLVMRNVAELISVPAGQPGPPSKALTLEQALALLGSSEDSPSVGLRGCQPPRWPAYRGSTSPPLVRS